MNTLFRHTLVIERPTTGAADDWNTPEATYATLATVRGLVQPKRADEQQQLNEAGAVVSTHTIYCRPTEIQPSDRVTVATGLMAGTYEIDGIRPAAGMNHHLEMDARLVAV